MRARGLASLAGAALAWVACKGDGGRGPAPAASSAPAPVASAPAASSSAPAGDAAPTVSASAPAPSAGAAPSSSVRKPMLDCKTDDDCVPKTCCHATECTLSDRAPSCDKARCGKKRDKTLDHGGKCVCTDGTCRAFTARLPRGIRDMGRDPF